MSLVKTYSNSPCYKRVGVGNYTYFGVFDSEQTGVRKIDIFADSLEEALFLYANEFGVIYKFDYINPQVITIDLSAFPNATCLLWQ